jgi:hypothetical protein
VHAGEFVFPQESVNRLGVGFLGSLAGLPGYAGGGPVPVNVHETAQPFNAAPCRPRRTRCGTPASAWAHEVSAGWYRDGTNYVPSDGMAYLHKGEAVVPASQNQGAPYRGPGAALMNVEHMHVNDSTDLELALRQSEFRQRSGAFS